MNNIDITKVSIWTKVKNTLFGFSIALNLITVPFYIKIHINNHTVVQKNQISKKETTNIDVHGKNIDNSHDNTENGVKIIGDNGNNRNTGAQNTKK